MQTIDGKAVRKFVFGRYSQLAKRAFVVEVHAFNKDHAIARLEEQYGYIERGDWEFIDEIDPEAIIGKLGETLPLNPHGVS